MIKADQIFELTDSKAVNAERVKRKTFSSVAIDSRSVKKSEIFFAIKGENTDGHKYIDDVIEKGVRVVVLSKSKLSSFSGKYKDVLFVGVKDTVLSLGELAEKHLSRFNIPVLCIGGANGKTTTKDLIAEVLSKKYKVLKTEGNLNNHIGLPLTLLKLNASHQMCVLEVGCNHFGEITYLCEICKPNFGLVTNIGKEHLEFFKNERGVAKAEFELYDYIRKYNNGFCFYNYDDKFIREYATKYFVEGDVTYSYNYDTEFKAKFTGFDKNYYPVFEAGLGKKMTLYKVATFGKHSVYNGFAATVAGMVFGVKTSDIRHALLNFKPSSSKRMQVEKFKGLIIINDAYNSNPDSVRMGLQTVHEYKTKGEKHIVLGDMLELGKQSKKEHEEIGRLISKMGFKNLYTYGEKSFFYSKRATRLKNNFHFESKDDLAKILISVIKKGDLIYVKGSRGMKMEDVIESIKKEMSS